NDLLVAVVIANLATTRLVYLPAGNWYDFFTSQRFAGGQNITWTNANQTQMPLFVREGAIIPMLSTNVQTLCDAAYVGNPSVATPDGALEFLSYPGADSTFTVYDGTTLECQTNGTVVTLALASAARPLRLRVFSPEPFSVERDGITLTKIANPTDF